MPTLLEDEAISKSRENGGLIGVLINRKITDINKRLLEATIVNLISESYEPPLLPSQGWSVSFSYINYALEDQLFYEVRIKGKFVECLKFLLTTQYAIKEEARLHFLAHFINT